MDNVVESMQMSSTMNLPRGVEQVKEENHDIKSLLAASNDNCWLCTSGPSVSREKIKGARERASEEYFR